MIILKYFNKLMIPSGIDDLVLYGSRDGRLFSALLKFDVAR